MKGLHDLHNRESTVSLSKQRKWRLSARRDKEASRRVLEIGEIHNVSCIFLGRLLDLESRNQQVPPSTAFEDCGSRHQNQSSHCHIVFLLLLSSPSCVGIRGMLSLVGDSVSKLPVMKLCWRNVDSEAMIVSKL